MKELSRRGFLKGSIAATTGLITVPSLVLPSPTQENAVPKENRGDAWEYANELAKRAMPLVRANFQQFRGIPFNYGEFFIIYRTNESGDSISINTGGHQSLISESNGETLAAILSWDGRQVSMLKQGEIETRDFLHSPSRYMARTLHNVYSKTASGKGELEILAYAITPRYGWQGVAQYRKWIGDKMIKIGDPYLFQELPDTFEDTEKMTGRTIAREIDFKTTAWRLVDQSNLQRFTEALEQKFG